MAEPTIDTTAKFALGLAALKRALEPGSPTLEMSDTQAALFTTLGKGDPEAGAKALLDKVANHTLTMGEKFQIGEFAAQAAKMGVTSDAAQPQQVQPQQAQPQQPQANAASPTLDTRAEFALGIATLKAAIVPGSPEIKLEPRIMEHLEALGHGDLIAGAKILIDKAENSKNSLGEVLIINEISKHAAEVGVKEGAPTEGKLNASQAAQSLDSFKAGGNVTAVGGAGKPVPLDPSANTPPAAGVTNDGQKYWIKSGLTVKP